MSSTNGTALFLARKLLATLGAFAFGLAGAAANAGEPGDDDGPEIQFELPDVEAHPGDAIEVPVTVVTKASLSLAAFSVEYETQAAALSEAALTPEAQVLLSDASSFVWKSGAPAGWVQVSVVTDFLARPSNVIPAGTTQVVALRFDVSRDAPVDQAYTLSFTRPETAGYDSGFEDVNHNPIYNHARRDDDGEFEEENEFEGGAQPALVNGTITLRPIIGDVSVFARGDANVDYKLDVSDPIWILGALFLGGALSCDDAADVNDDGELDISDPVVMLHSLFLGDGGSVTLTLDKLPDPTPDDPLGCAYY